MNFRREKLFAKGNGPSYFRKIWICKIRVTDIISSFKGRENSIRLSSNKMKENSLNQTKD